jgi:hypothetical protein
MGDGPEERNYNICLSKKLWIEKYHSRRFNHLSTKLVYILPSNIVISKLIYTMKWVAPLLEVDVSLIGSH